MSASIFTLAASFNALIPSFKALCAFLISVSISLTSVFRAVLFSAVSSSIETENKAFASIIFAFACSILFQLLPQNLPHSQYPLLLPQIFLPARLLCLSKLLILNTASSNLLRAFSRPTILFSFYFSFSRILLQFYIGFQSIHFYFRFFPCRLDCCLDFFSFGFNFCSNFRSFLLPSRLLFPRVSPVPPLSLLFFYLFHFRLQRFSFNF